MHKQSWKFLLFIGLVVAGQEDTNNKSVTHEYSVSSQRFSGCLPHNYYNGVNVKNRDQLAALLTLTHRRILPYTSTEGGDDVWLAMRELYPGKSPDTVRLIYSQTDMAVSLQGDLDGWNREHLWPRSYGIGNSGADYTDVHNIVPSEWTVNAVRGNKYFGSCSDIFEWRQSNASVCLQPAHPDAASDTQTNAQVFLPPASVRGDIARALMYMDVRYSGAQEGETDLVLTNCPGELDNSMGILSQLLQWHVEDPVSEEEQARNSDVCTCWQGNRNPFVDFPELAEVYFGSLGNAECENGTFNAAAIDQGSGFDNGISFNESKVDNDATTDIDEGEGTDVNVNAGTDESINGTTTSDTNDTDMGSDENTTNVTDAEDGDNSGTTSDGSATNGADAEDSEGAIDGTDLEYGGETGIADNPVLESSINCPGPGSVMTVGFNSDFPDSFALVALEHLSQGLTIYITDNGWTGTKFRDTEGYLKLEIPSGGMAAGTVFGYSQNQSVAEEFSDSNWENVQGNFDLSQSGDTMLVVCDNDREGLTFLTGLTFGGRWFNAGGDTTYSALPEALEQVPNSYVTLSHFDNYRYAGPTSGTAYQLRAAIANSTYWESTNDGRIETLETLAFEVLPPTPGEGDESEAPASDPQTNALGTSSNARRCCWNAFVAALVWVGMSITSF